MSVTKIILILANSIKMYPVRCVAGVEMIYGDGNFAVCKWIRAIDPSQPEGAITFPADTTWRNPFCGDGEDRPEFRFTPKV